MKTIHDEFDFGSGGTLRINLIHASKKILRIGEYKQRTYCVINTVGFVKMKF